MLTYKLYQIVSTEVIPYLMDIITPNVRAVAAQQMSQLEQLQISGFFYYVH